MTAQGTVARIEARGHPAIRLSHDATIELAQDLDITARATCVAGVASRVVAGSIEGLAGPVRLRFRIRGADVADQVVEGLANPRWVPGGGMVLRASHNRLPDTLVTDASCTAKDFGQAWRAAAGSSLVSIDVEVERLDALPGAARTVVLAHRPRGVVADPEVAAWLGSGHPCWEIDDRGPVPTMPDDPVLVIVGRDRWPGVAVAEVVAASGDDVTWEVVGLPGELAVACLLGGGAPLAIAPRGAGREAVAATLSQADVGRRAVVELPATQARKVLNELAAHPVEGTAVAIALDPRRPTCRYLRGSVERCAGALDGARHEVVVGVTRAPEVPGGQLGVAAGATDPALVRSLLAAGVPARAIIDALSARPGVRRNAVHAFVRAMAGGTAEPPEAP